jgi:hypothetical protein
MIWCIANEPRAEIHIGAVITCPCRKKNEIESMLQNLLQPCISRDADDDVSFFPFVRVAGGIHGYNCSGH